MLQTHVRLLVLMLAGSVGYLHAQRLIVPDSAFRNSVKEGQTVSFKVSVDSVSSLPKFVLDGINGFGIQFDTLGNFSWTPSFDLVDRLEKQKEINLIFQAEWKDGRKIRRPVNFTVIHQNRPPVVDDLPAFYVKQSSLNRYQISSDIVRDEDHDPLVFKSIPSQLPEGATLSSSGLLEWTPSRSQFVNLKNNPLTIEFVVQDQPEKAEAKGKIKVAQTQLDLPPEMYLVPGDTSFTIREDERLNFKIYVSDPNGDDNISTVNFLCADPRLPKTVFTENSPVQYEFVWTPGYDFVAEVEKFRSIDVFFFAIDKSNNKVQRKVKIKVTDAENIAEKDKVVYMKYRTLLVDAKLLIDKLDQNQKKLNKEYKQAKKGKKNRAIFTAGVGTTTGISGFAVQDPVTAKSISGAGGVVVGGMGTLEATEVLGKSKNDILEMIKTNTDLRNQLQIGGDNFARKYALKSVRREKTKDFEDDREKFLQIINDQRIATLELDATRPEHPKDSNADIRKVFEDFAEE